MPGILVHVLVSVIRVVGLVNTWKAVNVPVDYVVITSDKIVDTPTSVAINPNDGTNYWLIAVVWAIVYLPLLVFIGKYRIKRTLAISCL